MPVSLTLRCVAETCANVKTIEDSLEALKIQIGLLNLHAGILYTRELLLPAKANLRKPSYR